MNIVLEDVVLRRLEPKDVEQLYQYRNDWEVIRTLGGFSRGYALKDLQEWIEFHRTRSDEVLWAIAEAKDDRCLGHAGLYKIDHRIGSAEFAILIGDHSWWGRGLGYRVSRAALDFAFGQLNLHRVELTVLETHEPALRLYRKLGLTQEGVLRDAQFRDGRYVNVLIMSILREEFLSHGGV